MKRLTISAAAAAATLFFASGASAQDDSLAKSLQAADTAYAAKGYYPTGWTHMGNLDNGSQDESAVVLSSAGLYQIIGVCDLQCKNFDLQLTDGNGNQVSADTEDDDFPIVSASTSGPVTYRLKAMMKACTGLCAYELKVYIKK
ncbi:MAG: hypothetical protein JWN66_2157 [Sphingomonas bacterium]|uniref:hypothetical protein n=1 Tax=Sphingomonas bacterium TaxID=1895847 RepID=UPI00261E277C|nr:hypothetical protein [Sphingomonas bacterium]MDB5705041.1 hypothetical protein [Sphingomonas bacterium]